MQRQRARDHPDVRGNQKHDDRSELNQQRPDQHRAPPNSIPAVSEGQDCGEEPDCEDGEGERHRHRGQRQRSRYTTINGISAPAAR